MTDTTTITEEVTFDFAHVTLGDGAIVTLEEAQASISAFEAVGQALADTARSSLSLLGAHLAEVKSSGSAAALILEGVETSDDRRKSGFAAYYARLGLDRKAAERAMRTYEVRKVAHKTANVDANALSDGVLYAMSTVKAGKLAKVIGEATDDNGVVTVRRATEAVANTADASLTAGAVRARKAKRAKAAAKADVTPTLSMDVILQGIASYPETLTEGDSATVSPSAIEQGAATLAALYQTTTTN